MSDKPDYVSLKSSVSYIKHDSDCWYTACPAEGCNKKVPFIDFTNGLQVLTFMMFTGQ